MSYQEFAYYYDYLMDPIFYDEYLQFIMRYDSLFHDVIEFGCGTGTMAIALSKRNKLVLATDLSQDMLMVAKEKAQQNNHLQFEIADMTTYSNNQQFDLCLCLCDSINYLQSKKDVLNAFKNAFSLLKDKGLYIFDSHSIHKINTVFNDYKQVIEEDSFYMKWIVKKIEENKIRHWLMIENEEERIEEIHEQMVLETNEYIDLLKEVGFTSIEIFTDFKEYHELGNRHIFVCRKGE